MGQVPAVLHAFMGKGRCPENLAFTLMGKHYRTRRLRPKGPSKPWQQASLLSLSLCFSSAGLLSAALGGAATDELQEGHLQNPKARTPGVFPHFKGGHPERQVSRRIVRTPSEARPLRKACVLWEIAKMVMPR